MNAVVNPITRTPNFVRNHIWGGTVGAPIKKNKLFNFFTYEGWRTKEPRDAVRTMPTDLERTGDFSKSLNRAGGLRTIYDPTTTVLNVATNTATRQPFPNNIIPPSRIDPTAQAHHAGFLGSEQSGRRSVRLQQLQGVLCLADEECELLQTAPTGTSATS